VGGRAPVNSHAQESELLKAFKQVFEEGNRAWNSGDVKGAYSALPDDLDYRLSPGWPQARVLRGRDEVVAFFEDFQETFPDARTSSHEFIEVDERTVIVGFQVTGTGRSSGAGTAMKIWQVWELGEGMVPLRVSEFAQRGAALEAANAASAGKGGR
jgi:ketosteroid isomerase-like protein